MTILIIAAVVLAIVPLIYILADVAISGASVISLSFLTHLPTAPNLSGGGIGPMLAGSFIMVGLAALVSIPIGVGAGVFFAEWPSAKLATVSSFMNDVLTGFPSMVLGLFVFVVIVLTTKHFSAFAGGVALSFIMIPIIARTTSESLKLVPNSLREASMALGVPRWKTIFRIVISTGKTGLLTGVVLAIARATGETAPLLLTADKQSLYNKSLYPANWFIDCSHLQLWYFRIHVLGDPSLGSRFSPYTYYACAKPFCQTCNRKELNRSKDVITNQQEPKMYNRQEKRSHVI
jgi:phosphate transport system permease protein